MRHLRAARIVFGEPYVDENIDLGAEIDGRRQTFAKIDIAKIKVRNIPYDGAEGRSLVDAYVAADFYDAKTRRLVLQFLHPRWQENPKPPHMIHPRPFIPDEWNRRTLRASGEPSTINYLVKETQGNCAYGFRTKSQLERNWCDPELQLPAGSYILRLAISGIGARQAAEQWLSIRADAGGSIEVRKCKPLDTSPWLQSEPEV
jgi:hypothetical protein